MFKTHKSFRSRTMSLAVVSALGLATPIAETRADTLSELKTQSEALQNKVTELERSQKQVD